MNPEKIKKGIRNITAAALTALSVGMGPESTSAQVLQPPMENDIGDSSNFDYSREVKPSTKDQQEYLRKWYLENRPQFENLKKQEIATYEQFLKTVNEKCDKKKEELPTDQVTLDRINEADNLFQEAKMYHDYFSEMWEIWSKSQPTEELIQDSEGIEEYENSLKSARKSIELLSTLMNNYSDVLKYIVDQSFCTVS